jgi:hypothetical protein
MLMMDRQPKHPQTVQLLESLKEWCDQKYGRRSEVARLLNVSPSLVTDWLMMRRTPSLDHGNILKEFLKKERRSPRKEEKAGGEGK